MVSHWSIKPLQTFRHSLATTPFCINHLVAFQPIFSWWWKVGVSVLVQILIIHKRTLVHEPPSKPSNQNFTPTLPCCLLNIFILIMCMYIYIYTDFLFLQPRDLSSNSPKSRSCHQFSVPQRQTGCLSLDIPGVVSRFLRESISKNSTKLAQEQQKWDDVFTISG